MSLSERQARWVLLNYPVITSRSRDNSGGYDHMIGNLQVYRHLGYRVVCICRWSPRLIDWLEGALVLNIVPGAAMPTSPVAGQPSVDKPTTYLTALRRLAQAVRATALTLLGAGLQWLLRPRLLHQRANLRLMITPRDQAVTHLVELNDEYVPAAPCDAYLTVAPRPALPVPQFVWRWPVPLVAQFDVQLFLKRLAGLAQPVRPLKVLLFGIGGTTAPQAIRQFIASHPWFQGNGFELHIYGGAAAFPAADGVVQHGWCDSAQFAAQDYDAAVLYYDPQVYDDVRLRLGSPTKLWKYIDWSLPVFCNRPHVSELFLGCFDTSRTVLLEIDCARRYAEHLQAMRRRTLPANYADSLGTFLAGLEPGATTPSNGPSSIVKANKPFTYLS
jgi:hypothetical protein